MSRKAHRSRFIATLAAAGVLAGGMAACGESTGGGSGGGGGGGGGDTIKIGLLLPLTGPSAEPGKAGQAWGKEMETLLTADGAPLAGKKVKVITYDTKLDPATAASFARRLITRDGVVAISCCQSSAEALQVASVAKGFDVPLVGGAVLAALTDEDEPSYGTYFRASPGEEDTTNQIADYAADKGYKRIAISYAAVDYGTQGESKIAARLKQRGVSVVAKTPIDPTATDATGQANRIKGARPDAVISWDYPNTTPVVLRDLRSAGVGVPFVSNWSAHNDALTSIAGKDVSNVFAHTVWNPEKARTKELEAAFAKANGGTSPPGQQNNNEAQFEWVIGVGIANALKAGGTLDGKAVTKGLLAIKDLPASDMMMGADGSSITFGRPYESAGGVNPYHGSSSDALMMEEFQSGKWRILGDAGQ